MCGVLRGYRAMKDIMTCEICGCSFVDVESEDYTEVFTTGLCCECILEENWGNRMKFKIFNFCKHDYIAMVHVGSDIQNTVFKCSKCSKKYVMSHKEVMKRNKWGNQMKFRAKPLFEEGENDADFNKEFAVKVYEAEGWLN